MPEALLKAAQASQHPPTCQNEGVLASLIERDKSTKESISEVKGEYRYVRQAMEKQNELLQSLVNNMTELKITNLTIQQMSTDLRRVDSNVATLAEELQEAKRTIALLDKQITEKVFASDLESRERDGRLEQMIAETAYAPGKETLVHWSRTKVSVIASLVAAMFTLFMSRLLSSIGG